MQSVEVKPYFPADIVCLNSTYLSDLRKQKLGDSSKNNNLPFMQFRIVHLGSPTANYFDFNYRFIVSAAWKQDMGLNYMVIILKWHSYCIPVSGTRCFHPILCMKLIHVMGNYGQSPNLGHLSGVELVPGISLFPLMLIPLDSICPFVQVVDGTSVASDEFVLDEDLVYIFCKIKWNGSIIAYLTELFLLLQRLKNWGRLGKLAM